MSALDAQILGLQQLVTQLAEGDLELPRLRHELAETLFERCQATRNMMGDLSAAIFQESEAIEVAGVLSHIEQEKMALTLTQMLLFQWEKFRTYENLEAALERGIQTTTMLSDSSPELAYLHTNIARLLLFRNNDRDDLDAALWYAEDALNRQSENDPQYAYFFYTIGEILIARYRRESDCDDLENAITRFLQTQTLMADDDPMQKKTHEALGYLLMERYNKTSDIADQEAASTYLSQWRAMPVPRANLYEDEERASSIHVQRYFRMGNVQDLDDAISHAENQIRNLSDTAPSLGGYLVELAEMYGVRFERCGKVGDSKKAITVAKRAVAVMPKDHPKRRTALHSLAWCLSNHNNELRVKEDVAELIVVIEEVLSSSSIDQECRAGFLTMLAMMLAARFRETDQVRDLETGISRAREALTLLSTSDTQRIETLDCLSGFLNEHFVRTGDDDSMNAAVSIGRELIALVPWDDPLRPRYLIQLGRQLTNRSFQTGNTSELDEAISIFQEVNKALPKNHFQRIRNSDALAVMLRKRFERTGADSDNEEAIALLEEYVELTAPGSQERAIKLLNLGGCLARRFNRTNLLADLDSAISAYQNALKISFTKPNEEVRIKCLYSLAPLRLKRYELTGDSTQLDNAVEQCMEAVASLPESHPELVSAHYTLGRSLESRAQVTGETLDIERALESFKIACQVRSGKADYKIISAHNAMKILSERKDWTEAGRMANIAIGLMPRACSRKLSRSDQANALQNISSIAADACSISLRLGDVGQALQHVEFGRGLILGYLIDGQSDLSSLKQRDSSLANEYERLRVKASEASAGLDEIDLELEACERKIRQLEGFHNFLLQPFQEELKEAACDGYIVVVNISNFGSDAIVVSKSNMQAVELPGMMQDLIIQLTRMNPHLQGHARHAELIQESLPRADVVFLAWLWTACVRPILERILPDFNPVPASREIPRIWWIGVGGASVLPFHAATLHGQKSSMSTLDFVIPSYTPTIKALQNARQRASRGWENSKDDSQSLLIITMPSTPGASSLSGVTREQRAIKSAVKGTYSVKELERPDAQQVLDDIQRSQIVHFACHGASDPLDPLQSHLLLQKSTDSGICLDKLTVESLLASRAQTQAWIAYLSACSTAQVKATRLMNESLHITSAFQVAGFAHVIGTMWPVSDHVSIDVARYFYEFLSQSGEGAMSSDRVVAAALRNAVVKIRREYPDNPRVWAPYLHFGA